MTPMLDFATAQGAHPDHHEFIEAEAGCVFNVGFDRAEVPDLAIVSNPLDAAISVDVIDAHALFRDAPEDVIVALFERGYVGEDDILFRAATPCMKTGQTLYRVNTWSEVLSPEFAAVWAYVEAKHSFYSHRVVIEPGSSFATDNRLQLLHFPETVKVELSFAYSYPTHEDGAEPQGAMPC